MSCRPNMIWITPIHVYNIMYFQLFLSVPWSIVLTLSEGLKVIIPMSALSLLLSIALGWQGPPEISQSASLSTTSAGTMLSLFSVDAAAAAAADLESLDGCKTRMSHKQLDSMSDLKTYHNKLQHCGSAFWTLLTFIKSRVQYLVFLYIFPSFFDIKEFLSLCFLNSQHS